MKGEAQNQIQNSNPTAPDGEDEEHAELQFHPDKIPLKAPLVRPDACQEGPCIVYHSEA